MTDDNGTASGKAVIDKKYKTSPHGAERRRIQRRERRQADPHYKLNLLAYQTRYREKYPSRAKAHYAVSNGIRDGKVTRRNCEICGAEAQAHHSDYSQPLAVNWLCFKHHREVCHGQRVTIS